MNPSSSSPSDNKSFSSNQSLSAGVAEAIELDTHPSEQAFQEVVPEIAAMADDEAIPINTDIIYVVINMLGAMPEIAAMRPGIVENFKKFDLELFDRFKTYVLALNHANALYLASRAEKREATEQARIVEERRALLFSVATTLAKFGLLDERLLVNVKREPGHRALASDVLTLITLLKANWDELEGKCPLTRHDLNQAGVEVIELQNALGMSAQAPALRHEAAVTRRKAYTLFRRAYDPIARAAVFLYGDEGADEIVPKLTPGNTRPNAAQKSALVAEFDPESQPGAGNAESSASSGEFAISNPANLPLTPVFDDAAVGKGAN